jgi:class 3 adenylate cyclase
MSTSGHRKWTALVDEHDRIVHSTLARYNGRAVKHTGDGILATFDATTRAVRAATEILTQAQTLGLNVRLRDAGRRARHARPQRCARGVATFRHHVEAQRAQIALMALPDRG